MTYQLTKEDGTKYCPMRGHSERDCPGYPSETHKGLMRLGIGISTIPGPDGAELREELRNDRELMRDEYHGRDL